MDAGQGFVDTLPTYAIMPNPAPQYIVGIKLSTELLEHLQSKGATGNMTISFGQNGANIISVGNEQFSFRAPPEDSVTDCYRQVDDEDGGTFTKVGVVKRKIFITQKLRDEDRKRVKTMTELAEKERKAHKSVVIDDAGPRISKDGGKRKTLSSISKPAPMPAKRPRAESVPRPQLSSLSSLAAKHTTPSPSSLLSSPKRVPLRTQIVQMLALEPLPHEQIESKCTNASKTAIASTLQQVAKMKDGLYHLKKEMYREVDTNWPSFTPEDKAKALERKAAALQPEPEKKKEEPTEDIPLPEPTALEAKATGARYPSPVPRMLASIGKDTKDAKAIKEEKVPPARMVPPLPAPSKEKELAREREREREKEKERRREELARERREKEKEKEREKERERERAKEKEMLRERERKRKQERGSKEPSPAHSSASSASSSPSGSPSSQTGRGSSPNKAKEEVSPVPRDGELKAKSRRGESGGEDSLSPAGKDNAVASKARTGSGSVSEEYKRRRAEWEKMYKEYTEVHQKLKENAQLFQNLGAQLKRASPSEKAKIVHQISTDYQKRITRVRQLKQRFSYLHAEIKKEKAALIALQSSS